MHSTRFELVTSSLLNARSTTELRVPARGCPPYKGGLEFHEPGISGEDWSRCVDTEILGLDTDQIRPVADIETHPTEMRKVSLFALSVQCDARAPGALGSSR